MGATFSKKGRQHGSCTELNSMRATANGPASESPCVPRTQLHISTGIIGTEFVGSSRQATRLSYSQTVQSTAYSNSTTVGTEAQLPTKSREACDDKQLPYFIIVSQGVVILFGTPFNAGGTSISQLHHLHGQRQQNGGTFLTLQLILRFTGDCLLP